MPSLLYAVEVREANGGKPFADDEGSEKAGQIADAFAAGTAALLVGTVTAMAAARGGSQKGFDIAGGLMSRLVMASGFCGASCCSAAHTRHFDLDRWKGRIRV